MADSESFEQLVRDTLVHLHDLPYLQTHPLVRAVPAEPGARPAMAGRRLQRALLDAIEALGSGGAPGPGERIHHLLALRYVEALEVPTVRRELGLGKSEYYVQHGRGVAAVASLLREQLDAADSVGSTTDRPDAGRARRGRPAVADERAATAADDRPPSEALPTYLTSFVGRAEEVATLRDRLSRSRLVVLVGPAGAGKTRLAVEMAARSRDAYANGAWFVDLAPLTSHDQIAAAVTAALGIADTPGRSRIESIAAHLRARRALLILDNCEHLIAGAAGFADALLRASPELRILATSREPLGVAGETIWQLDPLPTPPASARLTAAELLDYDGARLFVDRAELAASSFALTDASAAAVGEVCRQLDGLPLALELAAARVRVLTVEQIAERLRERFRLLVSGRTAPAGARTDGAAAASARHQTLRALVDWSHDLLGDSERILFRRLAVFSGGWGLEAAEAICADHAAASPPDVETRGTRRDGRRTGDAGRGVAASPCPNVPASWGVGKEEMLDLLGSLVDKSLVVMEPRGGEARYRFLETMRQYAEEKLRLAGEADEVRRRHAAWYLALAEQAAAPSSVDRAGRALDRHGWCERLDLEHDNFRAALTWADRTADAALGLRLVGALHAFWSSFGEFWFQRADPEGRGWLDRFLAMHAERVPPRVRAKALRARAQLAVKEPADLERSDRCAAEALAICRSLDDRALLIDALHTQAMLKSWRDRHAEVIPFAREANALSREAGDPSRLLIGLARLGSALHETGDAAGAGAIVAEGAGLVAGLGPSVAVNLLDRLSGHVALARGDPAAAAAAFERSLAWNRSVGTQAGVWINLANLGAVALALGDGRRAAALFGQSLSELDYPRNGRASMVRCLLGLAAAASQPSTAARLLGAADGNWPASWGGPTADPEPRDRQLVDRVKAQLDASAFEAAWAEGRAMSAEQAIAFALEVAAELAASAPVDDQIERRPRG